MFGLIVGGKKKKLEMRKDIREEERYGICMMLEIGMRKKGIGEGMGVDKRSV